MLDEKYPFQIIIYSSYGSQPLKTNEISQIRSHHCEHTDLTMTKPKKFQYLVLNILSMTMFPVTDFLVRLVENLRIFRLLQRMTQNFSRLQKILK